MQLPVTAFPAQVAARQARLAEDDVLQQVLQEVAAALGLARHARRRRGAAIDAQIALEMAGHLIEGLAALRTAGEVHPARHDPGLEFRRGEDIAQEMAQDGLQAGELLRQHVGQRAPRRIALGRHHLGQGVIQAPLQQGVLGVKGLVQIEAGLLRARVRQREPPYLRKLVAAERREILLEAREKIGLGDQHVDRERDAQLLAQFLEPAPQHRGMLRPFRIRCR
ncbi:hypothetical protein D9M68_393610 [compost metagenome]